MKRFVGIAISLLAAIAIVVGIPFLTQQKIDTSAAQNIGIFSQEVTRQTKEANSIHKLYNGSTLVGVVSDESSLQAFLNRIYQERYAELIPNSSCTLGKDMYIVDELSYLQYEDVDDKIFRYLEEQGEFTLKVTEVSFADDTDIYAQIYTVNEEIWDEAMHEFLLFFISEDAFQTLSNGGKTGSLTTYGRRETGISISQNITLSQGYASIDEIKTTKEEVLEYLEYGEQTEKEYYTVKAFDTVAGVGSRNHGLTAQQIMNINRDKITSTTQVLTVGDELCVTYFNSPITVNVTKEALRAEPIYPETHYIEDTSLIRGQTEVVQEGVEGTQNALYQEVWTNGVLMKGTLVSSVAVMQAQDEIINVGTMYEPGVGTGTFQWPTTNAAISCGWMCYANHQAIDVINVYNKYGEVLAADSGVVSETGYHYLSGNYAIINHNNGYYTYYAHMNVAPYVSKGDVVTKGDIIGQIGMTGNASGPHIHFYVGVGGPYVNHDPCSGFLDCSGYYQ